MSFAITTAPGVGAVSNDISDQTSYQFVPSIHPPERAIKISIFNTHFFKIPIDYTPFLGGRGEELLNRIVPLRDGCQPNTIIKVIKINPFGSSRSVLGVNCNGDLFFLVVDKKRKELEASF